MVKYDNSTFSKYIQIEIFMQSYYVENISCMQI